MSAPADIKLLLLDIGGVLLTNGWDRHARARAAEVFRLDQQEMDERHHLTFDTYEEGKLSFDEYLRRVIFHTERPFTQDDFKQFMFEQSRPYAETIEFFRRLREKNGLRVGAISNEGRELTTFRVSKFHLSDLLEFIVASCFVHFRKPDADIYRMALDVAQVAPQHAVYIDDRKMYVEVSSGMGIQSIHHAGLDATREALGRLGLKL